MVLARVEGLGRLMRIEYQAQGGHRTERFRVEYELDEVAAATELYRSLFDQPDKDDALTRFLRRTAREFELDQDGALFPADANGIMDGRPTENAPASRERSGAEPSEVST